MAAKSTSLSVSPPYALRRTPTPCVSVSSCLLPLGGEEVENWVVQHAHLVSHCPLWGVNSAACNRSCVSRCPVCAPCTDLQMPSPVTSDNPQSKYVCNQGIE
jgi:hypothetical protein